MGERRRCGKIAWRVAFAAAALVIAGCAKKVDEQSVYAPGQCKRVALRDAESGALVSGAEDLAYDARNDRVFISAYDRRAAEKAAKKKALSIPEGGVYEISIAALLAAGDGALEVRSLLRRGDVSGGLRPHGAAYDASAGELVFINRSYRRINGKWEMTPRLQRVGGDGEPYVGEPALTSCAANDVLVIEDHVLLTDDHGVCDWRAGLEDMFALKRGGVSELDRGRLVDGVAYANGIVETLGGDIFVAATRANALMALKQENGAIAREGKIDLPGGPDNLTLGVDGNVIAAVHPSLMRIGLQRKLGLGRAPSRIVKVDPDRGDWRLLFDDPSGKLFSAATVAVETQDALIMGSVVDAGLLVCRRSG